MAHSSSIDLHPKKKILKKISTTSHVAAKELPPSPVEKKRKDPFVVAHVAKEIKRSTT